MLNQTTESGDARDGGIVERLLEEKDTWKLYGNHKVLCGWRTLIGPVRSCWWILLIHTILVTVIFFFEHNKYGSLSVTIAGGVLFLVCFMSSEKLLFSNPGIVKKPTFDEASKLNEKQK